MDFIVVYAFMTLMLVTYSRLSNWIMCSLAGLSADASADCPDASADRTVGRWSVEINSRATVGRTSADAFLLTVRADGSPKLLPIFVREYNI